MTYTFKKNGTYTFTIYDLAGNEGTATAEVDWIEPDPMDFEVEYSTKKLTNQDVTVTVTPSVPVAESEEELTHTFAENGSYTFVCTDGNGIEHDKTITVDWIDKTPPEALHDLMLSYSIAKASSESRINGPIVALDWLKEGKTNIKPFEQLHVFEENGTWSYEIEDLAGNKTPVTRNMTWIEKENPLGEIRYSTTDWTNQPVTVTVVAKYGDKAGVEQKLVFDANGYQRAYITDESGNQKNFSVRVFWIDTTAPTAEVEYSTTNATEDSVTATVVNASEWLKKSEEL